VLSSASPAPRSVQDRRYAIGHTVACAVYVGYFFELSQVRVPAFSDERLSFALAWLPNLLVAITSIAFLSARDDRCVRADG
jgi:hypothetical protein